MLTSFARNGSKFAEFFTNPIPFAIVNPAVQTELKGQSNYLKSMCLSVKGKTGKEHNLWKRGKWSIYCVAGIFYRRGSEEFLDGIGDI